MKIESLAVLVLGAVMLISCRTIAGSDDAGSSTDANWAAGRALFLKNCAHCHGADARGDEGPDLHKLDVSDEWIANRIRKGKAGEMTAFAGKLQSAEINLLVRYLQTLK
jgi:mono/diheme cytochrome c family protein